MREFGLALRLLLLPIVLLSVAESGAGEANIKKARGNKLVIEQGAEAGLEVGMEVTIVRPPGDAVIHPVSGENLGAPEIKVGRGQVTKTSARAATIVVQQSLLNIQPGDMVRFTTVEEELLLDQETERKRREKAQKERQQIQGDLSKLTRSIKKTQGSIQDLRNAIKRLDRIDDAIKVQLRGINSDIHAMKEDIGALKESVSLMGVVPVANEGEVGEALPENQDALKEFVRGVIEEERPEPWEEGEDPSVGDLDDELDKLDADNQEDEDSNWLDYLRENFLWFGLGIGLLLLIGAVLLYLKMKSDDDKEEDEDDDEDEDEDEDEDDDKVDDDDGDDDEDFDLEEEEDDIVVEETR